MKGIFIKSAIASALFISYGANAFDCSSTPIWQSTQAYSGGILFNKTILLTKPNGGHKETIQKHIPVNGKNGRVLVNVVQEVRISHQQ